MHVGPSLVFIAHKSIRSYSLKNSFNEFQCIPMVDNSEFLPLFRHELMRHREFGLLQRARDMWIPKAPKDSTEQEAKPLGFETLAFQFIILACSVGFAFTALGLEYASVRFQNADIRVLQKHHRA